MGRSNVEKPKTKPLSTWHVFEESSLLPTKNLKKPIKANCSFRPKKQTKGPKINCILIVFSLKKLFFQCNKTDVEYDLFEEVSIFVVGLGRFAPFAK